MKNKNDITHLNQCPVFHIMLREINLEQTLIDHNMKLVTQHIIDGTDMINKETLLNLVDSSMKSYEKIVATFFELPEAYLKSDDGVLKFQLLNKAKDHLVSCLLYTSPSPRDRTRSRMPSSA